MYAYANGSGYAQKKSPPVTDRDFYTIANARVTALRFRCLLQPF